MITISGQLAIRTIHGRNSDCNVGHLATSIDELVIKNAELDQYREGKYEGDFVVTEIRPSTYNISGQMVIKIRAHLGGMTLSNIEPLRTDEVKSAEPAGSRSDRRGIAGADPVRRSFRRYAGWKGIVRSLGRHHAVRCHRHRQADQFGFPARRHRAVWHALTVGRHRKTRYHRRPSAVASATRPSRRTGLRVRAHIPGLASRCDLITVATSDLPTTRQDFFPGGGELRHFLGELPWAGASRGKAAPNSSMN